MEHEAIVKTLENLTEANLQQGILIKVLTDIVIDKNIVTEDELGKYIIDVTKQVQKEINELGKNISDMDKMDTMYFGQAGKA